MRYREEVINIRLADILREMGFKTTGETISKGKLPDVMVYVNGVRINIEGRFEKSPQAGELEAKCKSRVEDGICDIATGILYPEELREAEDDSNLIKKIKNTRYPQSFIISVSSKGAKEISFGAQGIEDIAQELTALYTIIFENDILKEQIKKVDNAIKETSELATASDLFFSSKVVIEKLKDVLGIKKK